MTTTSDKTPLVRFLFEQARRHERAAEAAKKREDDAKASRKLQEEVEKLASTLWAGRDDHTAGLLREGIKAMQERDKLRLKADLYDEATYYLTRCGYGYPSAVENMPTATQMAEHALNHRSAIQGFLERALEHLGVPEKWLVRVRDGQMDPFFEEFPMMQRTIACACGTTYRVTLDAPAEDVPGLCPNCGGKPFARPAVEVHEEPFDDSDGVDDLDMPGAPDPYADEPGPDPWHNAEHIMGEPVCSEACVSFSEGPDDLGSVCVALNAAHVSEGSTCKAYRRARDKAIAEQYRTAREDEKAREDTEAAMEKRALIDFTSAMDAVRGKLTSALGLSGMTPWQDLVPAVAKLATDLANVKAESANVFLAVNVVREHLWKIRDDAAKALGEDVPDWTTGDEHTAARYVERLIERLEEREAERSRMVGTINRLEEDVKVLHEGDETEAGTWKLHYVGLCQEIGIPRSVYGDVKAPKVDEIARYMGQTYTPLKKLAERVADIENRLPQQTTCPKCGARYPVGVQFCPRCGKD